jgi:hypothetical protein
MCFTNIAPVVCSTCHRTIGERAVSTTPCARACGKFVSRPLASPEAVVRAPCAVCAAKEDERRRAAGRLNRHFKTGQASGR